MWASLAVGGSSPLAATKEPADSSPRCSKDPSDDRVLTVLLHYVLIISALCPFTAPGPSCKSFSTGFPLQSAGNCMFRQTLYKIDTNRRLDEYGFNLWYNGGSRSHVRHDNNKTPVSCVIHHHTVLVRDS
ncbi:hypothetical protein NPIL_702511 [Nephila pilipes]|uniref:Uncharacterized protein n=1 Tax=Nephila pilipes TaxID=299642 RepID=A0A8X6TF74_NEPPI|nr:hypothetical protein NPIL_702511 [Nephila pilipes]